MIKIERGADGKGETRLGNSPISMSDNFRMVMRLRFLKRYPFMSCTTFLPLEGNTPHLSKHQNVAASKLTIKFTGGYFQSNTDLFKGFTANYSSAENLGQKKSHPKQTE